MWWSLIFKRIFKISCVNDRTTTRQRKRCDRVRRRTSAWPYIRSIFDCEKANDYAERTSRSSYYVTERFSRDFYTKKRKEGKRKRIKRIEIHFTKQSFFFPLSCEDIENNFVIFLMPSTGIQDWKRFKSSQSSMCLMFAVVNHSHVSYSVDDLLTRTE